MRLLLDTQAFLWFVLNNPSLSAKARTVISDPANEIDVSPVTYWEIAIKISVGKYALNQPFQPFIEKQIVINRFVVLPIEPRHTSAIIGMPFHHRDPFDRLLVAQALVENIPLVSSDVRLDMYSIQRLW